MRRTLIVATLGLAAFVLAGCGLDGEQIIPHAATVDAPTTATTTAAPPSGQITVPSRTYGSGESTPDTAPSSASVADDQVVVDPGPVCGCDLTTDETTTPDAPDPLTGRLDLSGATDFTMFPHPSPYVPRSGISLVSGSPSGASGLYECADGTETVHIVPGFPVVGEHGTFNLDLYTIQANPSRQAWAYLFAAVDPGHKVVAAILSTTTHQVYPEVYGNYPIDFVTDGRGYANMTIETYSANFGQASGAITGADLCVTAS